MSIPKYELDKSTPLDTEGGINNFGSEETYFRLLEQYEGISLISDMEGWAKAVEEKDYEEVKERIHSIKGASAYAGAGRVTDHWYWMQYHFLEGENDKMMEIYPSLVESVVEFRVFHRKVLTERKGELYQINPEHETWPIAQGYRLIKIADYQYKCEEIPQMHDQEETEQLDQESEIPTPLVKIDANSSEKNQENEQKYIKSTEIENRLEGKDQVSNNQFEIDHKMDEPIQKSTFKNSPGDVQDKSDDSVKIKLDLDQSYKQQNDIGRDISNPIMTKVEDTNIIVSSNINENTEEMPKARWEKSPGNNSQPAIQIEREEADKAGGMWSCSKWIIQ